MKRTVFFLLTWITGLLAWSQTSHIDLIVQTGHSAIITGIRYSPDGKKLASVGMDHVIKLWDVKTAKEFRSIITNYDGMGDVDFSWDGKLVAGYSSRDSIGFWSVENGARIYSIKNGPLYFGSTFNIHPAKTQIAIAGLGLAMIDYSTGAVLWEHKETVLTQAIEFSPDGKLLIATGMMPEIMIYEAETGTLLKKIKIPASNPSSQTTIQVTTGKIVMNTSTNAYIFDLNTGKTIFSYAATMVNSAYLNAAETVLFVSRMKANSNGVEMMDIRTNASLGINPIYGGKMSVSQNASLIAYSSFDSSGPAIMMVDGTNGQLLHYIRGTFYMTNDAAFLNEGTISTAGFCGWQDKAIKLWDLKYGSMSGIKSGKFNTIFDMSISRDKTRMAVCGADSAIYVYNTENFNLVYTYRDKNTWLQSVAISTDNKTIAIGNFNGQVSTLDFTDKKPAPVAKHDYLVNSLYFLPNSNILISGSADSLKRTDYISHKPLPPFQQIGFPYVCYDPAGSQLLVGDHRLVSILDATTFKKKIEFSTPVLPPNPIMSLAYKPAKKFAYAGYMNGDIVKWNSVNGDSLQLLKAHSLQVRGLDISENQKHLVSGSHDSKVVLWDADKGTVITTLISMDSSNYIIYTPDNFYKATREGVKYIAFRQGDKMYPFEQYDLQYNRPDIILERMGYADTSLIRSYKRAYDKRLKRMGFTPDMFNKDLHLPSIQITGSYQPMTSVRELNLTIKAWDEKYKLDRINIYVNDVPVYGINGISLRDKGISSYEHIEKLILSTGKNIISVTALNDKGVESITEQIEIFYQGTSSKPNLYIYCIGTSKYLDARMNLNYAAKDASDLIKLFQSRTDFFATINTESITDSKATIENILALKTKLKATHPDDYVIIFVAGHGVLDQHLDYYLATYDMDFNNPAGRGLAYEKLEDLLDGIPARNKMIFMDACHSGEIDKTEVTLAVSSKTEEGEVSFRSFGNTSVKNIGLENSFELMRDLFTDLRKHSGATIISSAGGAEYAMEGEQWNNGVFTYCLIKGLRDKDADLNHDGKIYLSELQIYLQQKVPSVTQGKQKPTSRIQNLKNDFLVW